MQALLFDDQLRLVHDYPQPHLVAGEALIRPHVMGICHTDIEIMRGYMHFQGVLGHEFVGTVLECADSRWIGQRVVGEINAACRRCPTCLQGAESHCPHRTTLGIDRRDGVMAELFSLPVTCLHCVPDTIPDEVAVFVEPLAAALQILQQLHVHPTDRVAVVGDGKLGALIVQVLRLPGCAVSLIGRHSERWELFQRQGITCGVASDFAPGTFDVVVDCTGRADGLATARQFMRPRGRMVLKSTLHAAADLNLSMVVVDEVQLIGSRCGPFAPALRLLERHLIETAPLIHASFDLRDGLAAFAAAPGQLKVLVRHRH